MPPPPPSPNTTLIENIDVGLPYLRTGRPANLFAALRDKIIRVAGFDFLSVFGDMMRPKGFTTNQPGVSNKSRHKCGDAFDYNQSDPRLVVVRDPRNGVTYFRTFLRCEKQDGTQGELMSPNGGSAKFYVDFTSIAEAFGWHRIRAQAGWQQTWKKREFWHYQMTEGYTFDQGITLLYGDASTVPPAPDMPQVALNDRDDESVFHDPRHVRQVQAQLYVLKLLQPINQVDGAFGPKTQAAVTAFQQQNGLPVTGIADTATRRALLEAVL
ncbi:MAG TPA: peptidoglycan-binding domain-containing protein [Pyrinomonadaceae bacterium]